MMNCSLGNDGLPTYQDSCSFTCDSGYELTGSDTRTCQSDGSWSGTETMCARGVFISCLHMVPSKCNVALATQVILHTIMKISNCDLRNFGLLGTLIHFTFL